MSGVTERITNARNMLTLASDLQTDFQTMSASQSETMNIQNDLQGKLQILLAKKKDLDKGISTYEQDFLEKRKTLVTPNGSFQTLQDMILAIFFVSYALITIVLCAYVSRVTNSMLFFTATFLVMGALGVVISQIIIRFA